MVYTEDMIVNRINHHINHYHIDHHHIIHHRGIIYNILNFLNFSMKRSCEVSSINTIILEKIMKMKGCTLEGNRGSLILTLIGEADFRMLIEEIDFLILSMTYEDDNRIPMSSEFFLLMGIMILSQLYFGSVKLMSCLTHRVFLWNIMSNLCFINLKEGLHNGGIDFKTCVCTKGSHL